MKCRSCDREVGGALNKERICHDCAKIVELPIQMKTSKFSAVVAVVMVILLLLMLGFLVYSLSL